MANNPKGKWEKFRNEVIEIDDHKCVRCGKSHEQGAILQVHHKYYEAGRDYWDYPLSACETLCSGCHAKEHGIISPDFGWELLSDCDLGSRSGICDYCGNSLRYSYAIQHPNWGRMGVGEYDPSPFPDNGADFVTMRSMSAGCMRWVITTVVSFMREFHTRSNLDEHKMSAFWKFDTYSITAS